MHSTHALPLRLVFAALAVIGIGALYPEAQGSSAQSTPPNTQAALITPEVGYVSYLPPPTEKWRIDPVAPEDIALTWRPGCPVAPEELQKVTVTHWGFDGKSHEGTLIVNGTIAEQTLNGFKELYRQQFPINRISHQPLTPEQEADPVRGSTTAGFVCRAMRGSSKWSEHAYGTAIDINPYENPMVKNGKLVGGSPEFIDRSVYRPGMLTENSPAVRAFTDQGLVWGGHWQSSKDWMHFSAGGH